MIAAESLAKRLAQELFRVAGPGVVRAGIRSNADARRERFALLRCGDEAFFTHPGEDDVAARGASRLDQGDSVAGARASPAISAHSARFNCFDGRPNSCRDIVSTP